MKGNTQSGNGYERGSALLIAIFALMLISVVGLALVVSTGADSALAGNYRNSTSAYYAAVAGLEEARGRLLTKNQQYIGDANLAFVMSDIHNVLYILNPNPYNGETVNPSDSSSAYADTEYGTEFSWQLGGATIQTVASVSPTPSLPGPMYKWVRINLVSEQALGLDLDGAAINSNTLYYTGSGLSSSSSIGAPAIEITALAVTPDKSRKIEQYIVAQNLISSQLPSNSFPPPTPPVLRNQDFPAALTLAGNGVAFQGPSTGSFQISGEDQAPNCSMPNYMVASIGFINSNDGPNIITNAQPASSYLGSGSMPLPSGPPPPPPPPTAPASIQDVSTSIPLINWQTPSGLDAIAQNITANADVVVNGNATGNDILTKAPSMSATNPMTIVINGDLDLSSWYHYGYGLLLVTGTLNYDPDANWRGVVLVIGQGSFVSTKGGTGEIDGAVFIAKTKDGTGALLANLGQSSFVQTGGGAGIHYNSCWINRSFVGSNWVSPGAIGPLNYKIVSFREVTQ